MIGKFVTVLQSIFRRILPGDPLAILRKPGVCRILPGLLFPCLLFGGMFPETSSGQQTVQPEGFAQEFKQDGFRLPPRTEKAGSNQSEKWKQAMGDTGLKLGIVLGLFVVVAILFTRKKQKESLPREAVEVLGEIPIANRRSVQVIRFGPKLVLVESSPEGLKPISEMTDPDEVSQLVEVIGNPSN